MKKNTSQEALYERMRQLAEVNKKTVNESPNRTLSTLIDYKRAADGVAYGIVKENHHYYIKKGGLKQDPNIADFAYIGGLQNIKEFQYKSLAEADKNRNMIFHTINEAMNTVVGKTGSKRKLNEDVAGEEIAKAEKKLGDAEAAASAPAPEGEPLPAEPAPKGEPLPADDEIAAGEDEISTEPTPEGSEEEEIAADAEVAPDGSEEEEIAADAEVAPEGGEEDKDITTKEIEKSLGKLTNKIRKTEMTNSQIKSYVNTFLSAFKDKFPDVEIEDRKAMAEKITKVVPDKEIEDLSASVPQNNAESGIEEAQCAECGSFAMYAESRGYDSAEALMECGVEEVANLVGGYGTAHADGMNDGDLENVALVIKIVDPKMLDTLRNDYGHEEYADKLSPMVQGLNECSQEEGVAKLNELFGGLKSLGKAAVGGIGRGIQKGAQTVASAAKDVYQAGAEKAGQVKQAVGQAAKQVQQTYHAGEVPAEVRKLEGIANNLGAQIAALNTRLEKAGKQPVNVNSILTTIKNQVGRGGSANLAGKVQETMDDPAKFNAQPPIQQLQEEEESEIEKPEVETGEEEKETTFAPDAQSLGVGVIKPEGAGTINVDVNGADKTVSIAVNEVVAKFKEVLDKINEAKGGNKVPFIKGAEVVNEEKPSAGLSKEKKSDVVKAAKRGEDIGKKGKGFKEVEKKAKASGATDPKAVAAAAMWKNIKREGAEEKKPMSESEQKLRAYIRKRLEENTGIRKPTLNENKKSDTLKKLDSIIDEQFKLFKSEFKKK